MFEILSSGKTFSWEIFYYTNYYFILQTITEENDVQLKSYTKKDSTVTNGNVSMEMEKNCINVSKMVSSSPKSNKRTENENNKRIVKNGTGSEQEPYDNMEVTGGKNRYKRISQLAESVFGDKIVQQGSEKKSSSSSNVSRKESSVEGVSY